MNYFQEDVKLIFESLNSSEKGLSTEEAQARAEKFGLNEVISTKKINPLKIFLKQFNDFISYTLIFAAAFSIFIGEINDSLLIIFILFANAIIGFYQEFSAEKSIEALKKLNLVQTKVFRDNQLIEIDAKNLVPGDVIFLDSGDKVPADCRIISSEKLHINEALLTGESEPVSKNSDTLKENLTISEQFNMAFTSTIVVQGTAKAIVVDTGMKTEIGKIAELVDESERTLTPLQVKLDAFGKRLTFIVLGICLAVFLTLFFTQSNSFKDTIGFALIAISLAVAAVPTALPAVVTVALSLGVKRLLQNKSLVRKLASVESLGSCDVICSDKTGTLTKNEMTVKFAWTFDAEAKISGSGYEPIGEISNEIPKILFEIGKFCNKSGLYVEDGEWQISGNPTEAALLVAAKKAKINSEIEVLKEIPFDSERKRMSVLVKKNGELYVFTKGAPDYLLYFCNSYLENGKKHILNLEHREIIDEKLEEYAGNALRTLAFAYKKITRIEEFTEENLCFVGIQAMIDPPRDEVPAAIKTARKAGIRTIMITGDNPHTATAIAKQIGVKGKTVTGKEMAEMNDDELSAVLETDANIFARVVPEHKYRIVSLLQKKSHVVAMTGDGVNDAPALKKADIGIAIGSGTDVAKEAADFILMGNSFSHIVAAIREGRGIYENIQKSIMLLLSGNIGEVVIIFLSVILGFNLPLTTVLLLWINLITDGAPALAFSVDPYNQKIMLRQPIHKNVGILPRAKLLLILFLGIIGSLVALFLFDYFGGNSGKLELGQTVVFNFVVFYEVLLVFIIRQEFYVKQFSNLWLWASIGFTAVLQLILMYTPANEIFKIVPLGIEEIIGIIIGGAVFYASYLSYHLVRKLI